MYIRKNKENIEFMYIGTRHKAQGKFIWNNLEEENLLFIFPGVYVCYLEQITKTPHKTTSRERSLPQEGPSPLVRLENEKMVKLLKNVVSEKCEGTKYV